MAAIDTTRPDLYVHRLIDRLGLRRQQLFAAQADVVERLRALARFGELAAAYVRRAPQATPREFARADRRRGRLRAARAGGARPVGPRGRPGADARRPPAGSRPSTCTCSGCTPGWRRRRPSRSRMRCLREDAARRTTRRRGALALAPGAVRGGDARAGRGLCWPTRAPAIAGAALAPAPLVEEIRRGGRRPSGRTARRSCSAPPRRSTRPTGCCATSCSRATMRAGGRLGELRFDTDLDVSHAVVRYLELLKLAALIARPEGQCAGRGAARRQLADPPGGHRRAARDLRRRRRWTTTCSMPSATRAGARRRWRRATSPRSSRSCRRAATGVVLSASDIDTYRTCPLKYKFARVFRIPQEPTIHQRFGILVHQVLERFHARDAGTAAPDRCRSCSGCSTRAGGGAGSATPRRSASCAARPPRR